MIERWIAKLHPVPPSPIYNISSASPPIDNGVAIVNTLNPSIVGSASHGVASSPINDHENTRSLSPHPQEATSIIYPNFSPVKVSNPANKANIMRPLIEVLQDLSYSPLKVSEMRVLKQAISEYLTEHDLQGDKELVRLINQVSLLDSFQANLDTR